MSLSTLPDLYLLAVFDRIPLQPVDTLGFVCRRWNSLQPIVFNRRRSLILLISPNSLEITNRLERNYCNRLMRNPFDSFDYVDKRKFIAQYYKFSLLEFSTLEDVDTNWLIGTFPNITKLVVLHDGFDEVYLRIHNPKVTTQLITLLKHWSGKLKSLHYFQRRARFEYNPALIETINSMPVLKRLWLELNIQTNNIGQSQIDLPVLSQLDQFSVFGYNNDLVYSLTHSFQKYSVMNSDLKIAIESSVANQFVFEEYCNFNDQLAKRFVECRFEFQFKLMKHFYPKFSSLTKVAFDVYEVKLSQICLCLSSLKNLYRLNLFTNLHYRSFWNPFSGEDELASSHFPPLTSVRILELSLYVDSHLHLKSNHLSHIFPNVRWVYANEENGRCTICDIGYGGFQAHKLRTNKQVQSCFQQLVQPFSVLPKLEKIIDRTDMD